jgi:hypothetical protein
MSSRADEGRGLPAVVEESPDSMKAWTQELVARARDEGVALTGDGGL